jgi:predicted  nucleic acid-binding Zn-ribbon protein
MSQSSNLYRLQQIDSQLDLAQTRLQEIETALRENAALQRALEDHRAAEENLKGEQQTLYHAEVAVGDQRIKIEQSESMLYSGKVKNPKELQDLQNEVAALKRHLTVLEDRQLESMLTVEEAESTLKNASIVLDDTRARSSENQSRLRGEQSSLVVQVQRLEIERQAAASAIQPQDIDLYEQLRKQRRGVAITRIADKTCSACGTTLTPALIQSAHSPNQLTRCPSCSRILYPA